MKITKIPIEGIVLLEPEVIKDGRGYFMETFRESILQKAGVEETFVQDNESCSAKNTLRGLHFQMPPFAQGKLVRVVCGKALDVAVDIRKKSDTYGKWFSQLLSEDNKIQMYVPPGFAHGFICLAENTVFNYKCTQYYNKEAEQGLIWNDERLNIDWQVKNPIVSEKDSHLPTFSVFKTPF